MENKIFETIKETLKNDGVADMEKVTLDSSFDELGIDSITALLIINDLEEKFNVEIENEVAFKVSSIREAIELFKEMIEKNNGR